MAAAWAFEALKLKKSYLLKRAGIKLTSFKKYLRRRRQNISEDISDVDLVKSKGRSRTYPIEVDCEFVF